MNEFNEEVEGGAEGVELPDVDLDDGGAIIPGGEGGSGGGKSIVFAVVVVLLLAFQAVSSHFIVKRMFFSEPPKPKTEKPADKSEGIGQVFQISGLIVNPSESRGSKHLLVDIGLETKEGAVIEQLTEYEPLIRDNLNTFFSAQKYSVLQDIQFRDKLRQRVQEIVNYHLTEGTVDKVFFIQYVLQ
jgi:flagellar FliL protein